MQVDVEEAVLVDGGLADCCHVIVCWLNGNFEESVEEAANDVIEILSSWEISVDEAWECLDGFREVEKIALREPFRRAARRVIDEVTAARQLTVQ